jgi:perosamine synthetase
MLKDKSTYQLAVRKQIHDYKVKPFGNLKINGIFHGAKYSLIYLTSASKPDPKIISLLSKWRGKHASWFSTQFPVSEIGTQKWYQTKLIDNPDRLLFMIAVNQKYIGHIGLNRFDYPNKTSEIDNIIRGEENFPGLMEAAIKKMMEWGKKTLGIRGYYLTTFSDNEKALNLYHRLGFVQIRSKPLIFKKSTTGGEWVEAIKDSTAEIRRAEIRMKYLPGDIKPSLKKISFAGPSITAKEVNFVIEGVKKGFYETFDRDIRALEETTAKYVGVKYALAGFCATHSLHLACLTCGFSKGDEVIVTDFSWAATAHVIAYTQATPVFVDISPDTWCIDPKAVEKAITKKTKGIMLVHSFGMATEMDEIQKIAHKYNLKIIEDAAPALGTLYHDRKVGGIGDVGCISFHGAKIAASGEGGMFLTNNQKMYEHAVLLSNMGRTNRMANFWCDSLGFEYQMANVTAALARAQVERIEELVAMKRQIFDWYWERLHDVKELKLLKEKSQTRSNYAYPAVLLKTDAISRDVLIARLKDLNIHGRAAFPRMSRFPMYRARFPNPVAALVEKNGFNLPSALNLTERDIDFVCRTILTLVRP